MSERGDVRLNDAERNVLVDALRRHLADERVTIEEFEERAGIVYAAMTRAEADVAFADLPLLPTAAGGKRRRGRRHGEAEHPAVHWRETDEVFRDPTTGRTMRIWIDPLTGERHYVSAEGQ